MRISVLLPGLMWATLAANLRLCEVRPVTASKAALLELRSGGRKVGDGWVWRELSLAIEPGARLGIAGPSGAGKTLLLRVIAALDRLDEGTIVYRGRSLDDWSLPDYRARVMYLSQAPALMEGTVLDNLRAVFGLSTQRARRYDEALLVGWLQNLGREASLLRRSAEALSGGERQIVALLRALQLEPEILLLDEPTASLDPESSAGIEGLVSQWMQASPDRAVLWTSHRAEQLERVTDRRVDLGATAS